MKPTPRTTIRRDPPYPEIDTDAEAGFQLAQALRTDPAWQQSLLELRSEVDRLDRIDAMMSRLLAGNET